MIFDKLERLEVYKNLHPRFADAMAFLRERMAENAENGKCEMPNCDEVGAVSVNIFEHEPKALADSKMEAHKRYIDIQVVLEGEEYMYVPACEEFTVTSPYDVATDCEFFEMPKESSMVRICVPKGYFTVFFAEEPHAPGVTSPNTPTYVRKAVVKVLN